MRVGLKDLWGMSSEIRNESLRCCDDNLGFRGDVVKRVIIWGEETDSPLAVAVAV
jgi:hypothetical protein